MKKQVKTFILVETLIIIAGVIATLFLNSKYVHLVPKCIFKEKFGLFCPACNGTTFAAKLSKLNFIGAFKAHPVFFIAIIYLGLINIIYIINIIFNKKIKFFKWWHLYLWIFILLIYTVFRNIK